MSAHKMTLVWCDGGDECPQETPYADSDASSQTAARQRETYHLDGWRFVNGKDYCPDCNKRLFGTAKGDAGVVDGWNRTTDGTIGQP